MTNNEKQSEQKWQFFYPKREEIQKHVFLFVCNKNSPV
jgi:hypothetical protein